MSLYLLPMVTFEQSFFGGKENCKKSGVNQSLEGLRTNGRFSSGVVLHSTFVGKVSNHRHLYKCFMGGTIISS